MLSEPCPPLRLHDLGDRRADLVGEELQQLQPRLGRRRSSGSYRPAVDEVVDVARHRRSPERSGIGDAIRRRACGVPIASNGAGGSASSVSPAPPAPTRSGSSAGARSSDARGRVPEQRRARAVPADRVRQRARRAAADRAPRGSDPATRSGSREAARRRFRLVDEQLPYREVAGRVATRRRRGAACRGSRRRRRPCRDASQRGGPHRRRLRCRSPSLRARRRPRPTAVASSRSARAASTSCLPRVGQLGAQPAIELRCPAAARRRSASGSAARSSGFGREPARQHRAVRQRARAARSRSAPATRARRRRCSPDRRRRSRASSAPGSPQARSGGRASARRAVEREREPSSVDRPGASAGRRPPTSTVHATRSRCRRRSRRAPDGVATANARCTTSPPGTRTAVS